MKDNRVSAKPLKGVIAVYASILQSEAFLVSSSSLKIFTSQNSNVDMLQYCRSEELFLNNDFPFHQSLMIRPCNEIKNMFFQHSFTVLRQFKLSLCILCSDHVCWLELIQFSVGPEEAWSIYTCTWYTSKVSSWTNEPSKLSACKPEWYSSFD